MRVTKLPFQRADVPAHVLRCDLFFKELIEVVCLGGGFCGHDVSIEMVAYFCEGYARPTITPYLTSYGSLNRVCTHLTNCWWMAGGSNPHPRLASRRNHWPPFKHCRKTRKLLLRSLQTTLLSA